jgi:hypothetical protein
MVTKHIPLSKEKTMRLKPIKLIAAAVGALAICGSAAAFDGTMRQRNACGPDVFRLCHNYIPNVGEIVACLRGSEARLSEPCRQVMFSQQAGHEGYQRITRTGSGEVQ